MEVQLTADQLGEIEAHGEDAYPNEGGGVLLGDLTDEAFIVKHVQPFDNEWSEGSQRNRFALTEQTSLQAEMQAMKRGLSVIGVFHSHPDHPAKPSKWDLEWATWPNFAFLITTVAEGTATRTRAWRLADDRASYEEDNIRQIEQHITEGDDN